MDPFIGGRLALSFAENWFSFLFGYRVLDFDYVRGSGSDRFEYDMTLHGPFVAFQFKF